MDGFCVEVYHANNGESGFCGGRRDDHPQCGHNYLPRKFFEPKCHCGQTHSLPPEAFVEETEG